MSQPPAAILDALLAAVKQFAGAAPQNDDITALGAPLPTERFTS